MTIKRFPPFERFLWAFFVALPIAYLLAIFLLPRLSVMVYGDKPIRVSIQALGESSPESKSNEVWLDTPFGITAESAPGWEIRGPQMGAYQEPYLPLMLDLPATSAGLTFVKQGWSGKVRISAGDQAMILDLYSKNEVRVTVRPHELILRAHSIYLLFVASVFSAVLLVVTALLYLALRRDRILEVLVDRPVHSKNMKYVSRLDHLRFLAASMVIFYHTFTDNFGLGHSTYNPFMGLVEQGHMGVGLFMVLSGYLLTSIAYGKQVKYFDFIKNRILRIYPLYLLCVIVMLCGWRLDYTFTQALSLFFPFVNTLQDVKLPLFGHLWTVAVELQFYLIFPFLVRFLEEKGVGFALALLAVTVFFKILLWKSMGSVTNVSYITLLGRIDQFMVGMLAAYLVKRFMDNRKISPAWLLASLGFAAVVISIFAGNEGLIGIDQSWFMALWPTVEALMWAFLIVAYAHANFRMPASLDLSLARLGQLSFSMYCMHYVIIPFTRDHWATVGLTSSGMLDVIVQSAFLTIPCIVLFSMLTFGVIEKPFLSLKSRYAGGQHAHKKLVPA